MSDFIEYSWIFCIQSVAMVLLGFLVFLVEAYGENPASIRHVTGKGSLMAFSDNVNILSHYTKTQELEIS